MGFAGFSTDTLSFLDGIAAHNDKAWFDAHRDLYEAGYVAPARALVEALGPELRKVSPTVQFAPRVNGSLQRINRDVRFSKDKRPYKEHLNLWFWHGERKGWDTPGFWFSLGREGLHLGVGMHSFGKDQLDSFRQSVIHPRSGRALLAAVARVGKAGDYELGGRTRKLPPRGFSTEPDRADYLLHDGLYTSLRLPPETATDPGLVTLLAAHYRKMWPLGQWLLEEVSG
ncbi:MAG TPA: DUF2461 domain-containing protein [Devosia sp.]|nr:DUF2461 domain-containing protein [Devosia sp.]